MSSSGQITKLINIVKSRFRSVPKTVPGRWGNVGDFASCDDTVKRKREGTWATWTNMDHCGDDKCGTPKSYALVNIDVKNDKNLAKIKKD